MKYTLKAKQLLSTEHGAKSAGEVFEKEATPEEIELGKQLGLYEVAGDDLGDKDEGDEGATEKAIQKTDEIENTKPTPNPSQGEGGKAKKGGKQK